MDQPVDLVADLKAEDDEGLGWSTLSQARDASRIRPGVMLVAGNRHAQAVVRGGGSRSGRASAFHRAARLAGEEPSPHRPRPGLSPAASGLGQSAYPK
jgi:hypothetical protein